MHSSSLASTSTSTSASAPILTNFETMPEDTQSQMQTAVVYHQPQKMRAYPQNVRKWNSQLSDCTNNCGMCVYACLCTPCFASSVANKLGEHGCCLLCCVTIGFTALRTKFRTLYGIQGDIMEDCCVMSCCFPCGLSQIAREQQILDQFL